MVVDETVPDLYGDAMRAYFDHHGIALTVFPVAIGETDKTLRTAGAHRRRVRRLRPGPHRAGAGRRRRPDHRRRRASPARCSAAPPTTSGCPTTLIGLIDASVAIKVAVNHGKSKNRLGAFHASQKVLLDFSFLATLPHRAGPQRHGRADQDRGGRQRAASSSCSRSTARTCSQTRFGHRRRAPRSCARSRGRLTYDAIETMLRLEVPNLQELDLDRVIAFGHTWSPTLELAAGRALLPRARDRHRHGALDDARGAPRLHLRRATGTGSSGLMSRLGLSLDSPLPHPRAAAQGHRRDPADPRRAAARRGAAPDRDVPLRQRPRRRRAGRDAGRAPRGLPRPAAPGPRRGHVPPMSAPPTSTPRPVTPVGHPRRRRSTGSPTGSTAAAGVPDELRADLLAARELAAGLDPYLERCTTPESRGARPARGEDPHARLDAAGPGAGPRAGDALRARRGPGPQDAGRAPRGRGGCSRSGCSPATPRWPWPRRCPTTAGWWPARSTRRSPRFARRCFAESPAGQRGSTSEVGPAGDTLAALAAAGEVFDLVFIDADKAGYLGLPRDAVLDGGPARPARPDLRRQHPDAGRSRGLRRDPTDNGAAIAAFNQPSRPTRASSRCSCRCATA